MPWEVQTLMIDGWENTVRDGDTDELIQFATEKEAQADLKDLLHSLKDAVDTGDMEDYYPDDWRVQEVL
jgi:hypothetical protein